MEFIEGRNGGKLKKRQHGDPPNTGAGRPKSKTIIEEIAAMMEGDGFATIEGELLDDDGRVTGQIVKVKAKVPNMQSAARAYAANMKKGDVRTLQIYLDRTLGPVKQMMDVTTNGGAIGVEAVTPEMLQKIKSIVGE